MAGRIGIPVLLCIALGCQGTSTPEPSVQSANSRPRAPSPMPSPWITAAHPHEGFNDEPALAMTQAGDVYVGWISYRDGGDSLVIARFAHEGDRFLPKGQWIALEGSGTYLLGLRAVAAGSGTYFVFAREVDGNWDVFSLAVDGSGPSKPIRIAAGPATQIKPSAAWHEGTLIVAWEANPQSERQILMAALRNGSVTEPEPVSLEGISNYGPSVAVAANGKVSVAWHGHLDHNYDIFLREREPSGEWNAPRRLTESPGIDRHPQLLLRGDERWIVYEHARMEKYFVGRTDERHLVVAKVTPRGIAGLLERIAVGDEPIGSRDCRFRLAGAIVDCLPAATRTARRLVRARGWLHRREVDRPAPALPASLDGPPRADGAQRRPAAAGVPGRYVLRHLVAIGPGLHC